MVDLLGLMMILDLHKQGLSVSAIAKRMGLDRKTVRKYIERGAVAPQYSPRPVRASVIAPFEAFVQERVAAWPELTGTRLLREIRDQGYAGSYTVLKRLLRRVRPAKAPVFEHRFEKPAGHQAQVDFAEFRVEFDTEPGQERKVWLFAMVLGHSRYLWAQFVLHQDLPTLLRCHMEAFEHFGGAPREILYDRMKTAVLGARGWPRSGLQRQAAEPGQALRLHASRLPALPGKDQGQGGASLPLHPCRLLHGPALQGHR